MMTNELMHSVGNDAGEKLSISLYHSVCAIIIRLFPTTIQKPYAGIVQCYFEIPQVHLKMHGFT